MEHRRTKSRKKTNSPDKSSSPIDVKQRQMEYDRKRSEM